MKDLLSNVHVQAYIYKGEKSRKYQTSSFSHSSLELHTTQRYYYYYYVYYQYF